LSGTKPYTITGNIVIINYDILYAWVDALQETQPQVLITDEAQLYKNNKAKRTRAIKMLGKNIPHIIALSGTPIVNRPIEMYNALKLIDPTIVPNFWEYAQRYCAARHNGYGWNFNGASNTEELHEKLTNTIMLRRLKKDVLSELPEKIHTMLPMEIDNRKEYTHAENNFIRWIRENQGKEAAERASNAETFTQIEALKQLAAKGKIKQAIEWIENFLDTNGKLVVFTTHKNTINILMEKFKEVATKVDGSVTGNARQEAVDKFQNDKTCCLFVGNIKAAGVGLTLTAASNVAFLELPWSPGEVERAADRVHRIGQKNAVNIYYLLASNTIDERIARMLDDKRKVLDQVLDGKESAKESLLSTLINEYKKEEK
jgi:SNF2 family DNA or RNA helicase